MLQRNNIAGKSVQCDDRARLEICMDLQMHSQRMNKSAVPRDIEGCDDRRPVVTTSHPRKARLRYDRVALCRSLSVAFRDQQCFLAPHCTDEPAGTGQRSASARQL